MNGERSSISRGQIRELLRIISTFVTVSRRRSPERTEIQMAIQHPNGIKQIHAEHSETMRHWRFE